MANDIDIVSRISKLQEQFSEAEKKIARLILEDLNFAAHASINALARRAAVSEATVTRFAKALDCKDVRHLKLRLAQSLAVGQRFISEVTVEPSGIHGVYESIKSALDFNAGLITSDIIEPAADLVSNARQVLIFGVGGGSTIMGQECQHRLFRLGVAATAYSDPMLMRMAAAAIEPADVVIALSLGGYSPDVTNAVSIAREYGAKAVAITAVNTPLAEACDRVIPIAAQETDYIFKPSASRYVLLAAIDVLATEVAIRHKRKSREKLRRLKLHLDNHKHGIDRLPLGD